MRTAAILAESDRMQALYTEELTRLQLPDDGEVGVFLAVRSMYPAGRLAELWVQRVSMELSHADLQAAADYFRSVPGQAVAVALYRAEGAKAPLPMPKRPMADEAGANEANAGIDDILAAIGVSARQQTGHRHAQAAALWTWRQIQQAQPLRYAEALAEVDVKAAAQAEATPSLWSDNIRLALLHHIPSVYLRGLRRYATSDTGRKFFQVITKSYDQVLRDMVRNNAGLIKRAAQRTNRQAEQGEADRLPLQL